MSHSFRQYQQEEDNDYEPPLRKLNKKRTKVLDSLYDATIDDDFELMNDRRSNHQLQMVDDFLSTH